MLNLLLAAVMAGAVPQGVLTLKVGDLQVTMDSKKAWTISTLSFQDAKMILPLGGQGAVLATGGQWVGSGMKAEETEPVSALAVTVDGQPVTLALPQTITGSKVTVAKESMLAETASRSHLKHTAHTTLERDMVVQRHTFEATADLPVASFYAFIYSLWPEAKSWLAQPITGDLRRGSFTADKGSKPLCPVRWLAQYDPAMHKGLLAYFPDTLSGPGAHHTFWDTAGYHKLFAQPLTGKIPAGTKLDLTLVMQPFSAAPGDWEQQAQDMAKALQTQFPPKGAASGLTPAAPPQKLYGEGVPEDGLLTLKTAHYTVPMSAKQAWTIHHVEYDGKVIAHEKGFYGTVMVPKGGNWWGTGHTEGGKEIVHAIRLLVDGKEQPLKMGETVMGHSLKVIKESTIWKLRCHAEVEVTDNLIFERTQLEPTEDIELKLLYLFMHCFVPTTTKWAAELPDGSFTEGLLPGDGGFEINKDTRWVAQYEPAMGYGIVCYTPRVVTGPGSHSMIWDLDTTRYHKYYIQANSAREMKAGEKFDYSLILQVATGEQGDWAATKQAVAALKQLYPPE
jgi:hypothetical protein